MKDADNGGDQKSIIHITIFGRRVRREKRISTETVEDEQ